MTTADQTATTEPEPDQTPGQAPAHEPAHAGQGAAEDEGEPTPQAEADEGEGNAEGDRRDPAAQAARYRRRLRDVETERDQAVAERDSVREALLRDVLIRESNLAPSALEEPDVVPAWDAILDESGNVSPELVRAHMTELGRLRPHLFHRSVDPIQGRTRGGAAGGRFSWSDVLSGRAQQQ